MLENTRYKDISIFYLSGCTTNFNKYNFTEENLNLTFLTGRKGCNGPTFSKMLTAIKTMS